MSETNESLDESGIKLRQKEEVLERHRLERKQLNAKTTQLRHSLTKGDKKKKKDLNSQIDSMSEELRRRHENELKELSMDCETSEPPMDVLSDQMNSVCVDDSQMTSNGIRYVETKISRAQRRREAKDLKDKQRQQLIVEGMVDDSDNQRLIEAQKLKDILSSRGLTLHEIPSDGDCMYRAIGHQLSLQNIETNVQQLRQKTCDYMKDNKMDFIPFLTSETSEEMMNDSEYENYCQEIAVTKSWGGQLELRAISHIYGTQIEVIQSEGNHVFIGQLDHKTNRPLIICYLRHAFSLGEHYDSVRQLEPIM